MAGGRPTKNNKEIQDKIVLLTSTTSKSLKTICKELGVSPRSVLDWLAADKEFSQNYARGKEEQADLLAEEIIEIADNTTNDTIHVENDAGGYNVPNHEWIARSRLRVDARKFIASKLKPKKYGDKIDHTTNGKDINTITKIEIEILDTKGTGK